ncbi:NADH dehydrogenase [ubiquinone] 1 alpha subcomplex subunit N7BM [Vanrija pseudolonga]|uniref:NADH dehydrogenase [ubiquinone] 1 alpha subcomplex subunit n=1 Tax=Vanrija pseudolonga TaxID=143232 RepID=A0AAF0YBY5_9TREE|nr:NADH dehydrogenase [ubiquinone] 1 alpha subcomplex subunit N7BM [Vanrija pseudolonga]
MSGLQRTINHARKVGFKEWFRMMTYIGDAKYGTHVGTDQFGNRYFQQYDAREELPGRQRWVDYAQDDFNASQVPRGWASWLAHTRLDPPPEDPIYQASKQKWETPYVENLTGTRGRFITYSTQAPKSEAWKPEVKPRA